MGSGPLPTRRFAFCALLPALALGIAGCAPERPGAVPADIHIPPFAKKPYQRFSREAAVQIALPKDLAPFAFEKGSVDAWAIWDPYTSQAKLEAGAQVLTDGRGIANGYTFQVASSVVIG